MANKLFQLARNAVQQAVGRFQGTSHEMNNFSETHANLTGHDMEVAQNALSSAMANSSDAERAQLAELQQELDGHSGNTTSQPGYSSSVSQEQLSSNVAEDLSEDNQQQ